MLFLIQIATWAGIMALCAGTVAGIIRPLHLDSDLNLTIILVAAVIAVVPGFIVVEALDREIGPEETSNEGN